VLISCAAVFLFIYVPTELEIETFLRVKEVFISFITLDPKMIIAADHSASIRIVPTMMYIENFSFIDTNIWLGNGIDYSKTVVSRIFCLLGNVLFSN
jgi:hypothetical protein